MRRAFAIGVVVAVSLPLAAAARVGAGSPSARGHWACSSDSPSHRVRLWWNEQRRNEHTVPERFEKPGATTYTDPPTDGRCATRPQIVGYLAQAADRLLRRDGALGLPAPSPDTGMPATYNDPSRPDSRIADGGSKAVDVYLDGSRALNDGETECVRWAKRGFHTAAYVRVYGVRTFNQADLDKLTHTLAHELVHVTQCAIKSRNGAVNGTSIDRRIVEATAEAFAVASSGKLDEGLLEAALRRPRPVIALTNATPASDADSYAQFPFWYALFDAPHAHKYVAFLHAAVAADAGGRVRHDGRLVYTTFGEAAVQHAIASFASFAILGGTIGGATWDPATHIVEQQWLATLAPDSGQPGHTTVRMAPGAYGFVAVNWPGVVDTLTVTASGAPAARAAESVVAGTREGGSVTPAGEQWVLHRTCQPNGACDGDGRAYIAVANGRRSPLALTLVVSA